jgi:hypothetical protein
MRTQAFRLLLIGRRHIGIQALIAETVLIGYFKAVVGICESQTWVFSQFGLSIVGVGDLRFRKRLPTCRYSLI